MANGTGISNYVFPEDRQEEENALTQKLYEYAISQPKASLFTTYVANPGYEMGELARNIQKRENLKYNQKEYLKEGAKWLSGIRRRYSDAEIMDSIKNDPVFRRRVKTLQNPETFSDDFWWGL